jgi:ABC-type transporter Mla maintaining outer membrane lipid asymmetry ATPase subunit MlaF
MSRLSVGMPIVEAHELTKRYGRKLAVDHLSFTVQPGKVTGFLGPNRAGKSTTMRLLLGLDRRCRAGGSMRCWTWLGCARWRASGLAASSGSDLAEE